MLCCCPPLRFVPRWLRSLRTRYGPNRRLGTFTNFANLCDMAAFAVPIGRPAIWWRAARSCVVRGTPRPAGRLVAPSVRDDRRCDRPAVAATRRTRPAGGERDRIVLHRRPYVRPAAELATHRRRWSLPARNADTAGVSLVRPRQPARAWSARCDGAAIAGEVWALPTTAIGVLLAQVPPPLGFGTVTLDDGPCLGFLAESAGVADATEITHLGGWRAWLRSNPGD